MSNMISHYMKLCYLLYNQLERMKKLNDYINRLTTNDKIAISNFAIEQEISQNTAESVLDTLCDMQILKKTERMYRCPNCGLLLGILSIWDEGDDIHCYNCDTTHPRADICDTETIYSLYVAPTLKIFKVEWTDKRNGLIRHADIIAYTQVDAKSVIQEYEWPDRNIKVSNGIEIENKMLLKEYN